MSSIKWSYMDHWSAMSARGTVTPYSSIEQMDMFIRQLAAVGLTGIETFCHNLHRLSDMFGSVAEYEAFLQQRGVEKIVNIFWAAPNASPAIAMHRGETHGAILDFIGRVMRDCEGLAIENFIVMPTNAVFEMEPVDDEKIRLIADLWNRAGEITRRSGIRLAVHHEFWCGIRSLEEIEKFYAWTDPDLVHLCIDTAQHVIAGVDPVALYRRYADRVSCFHFKDTRHIDRAEDYRTPPDPELAASTTGRWFYEMGTPGGLVDFPAMMAAMRDEGYSGWIGVEHDKANIGGGDYAETTANAMWYAHNKLAPIYG